MYNGEFTTLASYITGLATKDFNGASLLSGSALTITIDSEGAVFTMAGVNLNNAAYTNVLGADVTKVAMIGTHNQQARGAVPCLCH